MNTRSTRALSAALLMATFLLGIRDGHLALWKHDDPTPIHVFPFLAGIFPEDIRNALKNGIHVEEDSDIGRLLQDMIS